jgi:hypothetical protein
MFVKKDHGLSQFLPDVFRVRVGTPLVRLAAPLLKGEVPLVRVEVPLVMTVVRV